MELNDILGALGALIFVLALIWGTGLLIQRFNLVPGLVPSRSTKNGKRLHITDVLALDSKRRIVIVRKDEDEFVLLLGPQGDQQLFSNEYSVEKELTMINDKAEKDK